MRMSKLWQQLLLVPTVVRLTSKAPRDPHTAWDRYWTGVRATGSDGDVLWDSDSAAEHAQYARILLDAFDPALPAGPRHRRLPRGRRPRGPRSPESPQRRLPGRGRHRRRRRRAAPGPAWP